MSLLTYEYRLYPSRVQIKRLNTTFIQCKSVYNTLLDLNKNTMITNKSKFDGLMIDLKLCDHSLSNIHSQVLQNVGDRLSKSFDSFFRRCKDPACRKKGFPRFKSKVSSITYPQSGFKIISDKKLSVSKIGNIPLVLHRVPKGKIKTMTIKKNKVGQWFVTFACELPDVKTEHQSVKRVGIDVGIESFAVLSDGEFVDNKRHLIKSEAKLKLLHRRLSRKKKGSANRRKAITRLAKAHLKVSNQRKDFLHKLSFRITKDNSFIAVEDLNISNMVKNHSLAKHISDASWYSFTQMLSYKAVTCGGRFVKVNPRNTSKTCSGCGAMIDMPLDKRQFDCPVCSLSLHRDLNSAINILKVGTDCAELNACGDTVRPSRLKARVVEAGTIMA